MSVALASVSHPIHVPDAEEQSVANLYDKARRAIAAGEHKLREAAECLAAAKNLGATQRASAKAIGKSPAWVNQLLAWRESGYEGGAFERSHKSRAFSPAKQPRRPMTSDEALAQKAQAEFQTERAKAVTAMFGTDSKRIPADTRDELIAALNTYAPPLVEAIRNRLNMTWDELLIRA